METMTSDKPLDLGAWIRDLRGDLSQDEFVAKLLKSGVKVSKAVISLAERDKRGGASVELVALLTYAETRNRHLDSLEKVWSAAMGEDIKISRPANAWVHELEPYLVDATPETINLVIDLVRVATTSAKQQAAAPRNTKLPVG